MPVGGRLKFFIDQWRKITDHKWVLSTISKWYKLEFQSFPPLTGIIQCNSTCIKNYKFRGVKVVRKSCNRACTDCRRIFRFLQYSFSGTQKDRRFKACNKLETPQPVSQDMDTLSKVINLVRKGDLGISVDLQDLHIFTNLYFAVIGSISVFAFRAGNFSIGFWHLDPRRHLGYLQRWYQWWQLT